MTKDERARLRRLSFVLRPLFPKSYFEPIVQEVTHMRIAGHHPPAAEASDSTVRAPRPRRARIAEIMIACFFVVFLTVQVAVPIGQMLWAPRPARFGWQMYSVVSAAPQFDLMLRDGSTQPVAIEAYVTSLRSDVPLARYLPPHLCRLFPQAAAVRYQMHDGSQSGTYRCAS